MDRFFYFPVYDFTGGWVSDAIDDDCMASLVNGADMGVGEGDIDVWLFSIVSAVVVDVLVVVVEEDEGTTEAGGIETGGDMICLLASFGMVVLICWGAIEEYEKFWEDWVKSWEFCNVGCWLINAEVVWDWLCKTGVVDDWRISKKIIIHNNNH